MCLLLVILWNRLMKDTFDDQTNESKMHLGTKLIEKIHKEFFWIFFFLQYIHVLEWQHLTIKNQNDCLLIC